LRQVQQRQGHVRPQDERPLAADDLSPALGFAPGGHLSLSHFRFWLVHRQPPLMPVPGADRVGVLSKDRSPGGTTQSLSLAFPGPRAGAWGLWGPRAGAWGLSV